MFICHVIFGRKLFSTCMLRRTVHGKSEQLRFCKILRRFCWGERPCRELDESFHMKGRRITGCCYVRNLDVKQLRATWSYPWDTGTDLHFVTVILYSWDVRDICASWLIWVKIYITFMPLEFTLHGVYMSLYMHVSVLCNTRLSDQRVHTGVVHIETLNLSCV